MIKLKIYFGFVMFIWLVSSAFTIQANKHEVITLVNSTRVDYSGVVELDLEQMKVSWHGKDIRVLSGSTPIASQWCDKDGDGKVDVLCVEVNIKANSQVHLSIAQVDDDTERSCFKPKTQAEIWHKTTGKFKDGKYVGGGNFSKFDSIRVPDGFTDHAYFLKYEGPGWESDKVGYRLYLDWRNAVDVFGKKVSKPILQEVGLDGYESYHHMQHWGMDVLKVGKSLGIGSIAWWNNNKAIRVETTDSVVCKILSSGLIRSQVQTWYYGWQQDTTKVNMVSIKSIDAGSRLTHEQLSFDKPVKGICTGIRKESATNIINLQSKKKQWGCLATWGAQSLNNDQLGLAIIYPLYQQALVTHDEHSHVVVFNKELSKVEYYFLAAWELEKEGIKTEKEFIEYLNGKMAQLDDPVIRSFE